METMEKLTLLMNAELKNAELTAKFCHFVFLGTVVADDLQNAFSVNKKKCPKMLLQVHKITQKIISNVRTGVSSAAVILAIFKRF